MFPLLILFYDKYSRFKSNYKLTHLILKIIKYILFMGKQDIYLRQKNELHLNKLQLKVEIIIIMRKVPVILWFNLQLSNKLDIIPIENMIFLSCFQFWKLSGIMD